MKKTVIAGHKVNYEYENWDHEISDDDSDYEHIQEYLIDGYVEGEIVTYDPDTDETHYGYWWKIS